MTRLHEWDKLLKPALACCLVGLCAGCAPAADASPSSEDLILGPYVNYVTESNAKILWVASSSTT